MILQNKCVNKELKMSISDNKLHEVFGGLLEGIYPRTMFDKVLHGFL